MTYYARNTASLVYNTGQLLVFAIISYSWNPDNPIFIPFKLLIPWGFILAFYRASRSRGRIVGMAGLFSLKQDHPAETARLKQSLDGLDPDTREQMIRAIGRGKFSEAEIIDELSRQHIDDLREEMEVKLKNMSGVESTPLDMNHAATPIHLGTPTPEKAAVPKGAAKRRGRGRRPEAS